MSATELPPLRIDDEGPFPVRRPTSVAELGDIVRMASERSEAIYPRGGGTQMDLGFPPGRPGLAVDTTALTSVIDYPARDMTITVQAGLRVAELQRLLRQENQRLPIDVPQADRATVGGILAANVSGPRRLGSGTLRDYLIGISVINDEGVETRAGGRVVKNVAGYDLCKLHTGALGTLGVLSQVTFKVRPLPEKDGFVWFACRDQGVVADLLEHVHASRTRPMSVEVVNRPALQWLRGQGCTELPDRPWCVLVGFEESSAAVDWQIQQLLREVQQSKVGGLEPGEPADSARLWTGLTDLTLPATTGLSLKICLPSSELGRLLPSLQDLPGSPLFQAHAANGIARLHWMEAPSLDAARDMIQKLARAVESLRGVVSIPRCPSSWKASLPIWGPERKEFAMMSRVKQALDPGRLFNPGRFVNRL
ncbi:MAG: FAD-binding oxidoreductase [Gemmataceae bacterium]